MQASIKAVREFITSLGFDPENVLEIKIDGHAVIVFYGDPVTNTARLAKLPIVEVIEQ